jgi:hypothetical protein
LLDQSLLLSNEQIEWARRQLALLLADAQEANSLLDQAHAFCGAETPAAQRTRAFVDAIHPEIRAKALRVLKESLAPSTMTAEERFRLVRLSMSENDWPTARDQMLKLLARDQYNPA